MNMPYGFRHLVSQDGQTWYVPRKFLRDALELEIDKVVGYKVLEDSYHLWYIAKSYSDCYGNPNELPFGKTHSDEYARRSIWYFERFLKQTQNVDNLGPATRECEMAYFALVMMGTAYNFMGNVEMCDKCFNMAHTYTTDRNEHYLHHAFILEGQKRYEEVLQLIDKMVEPSRVNPFPKRTFLIEDRAYLSSSNFLNDYREKIKNKMSEHTIDLTSVKFDFN